jgi:hypothetical protein
MKSTNALVVVAVGFCVLLCCVRAGEVEINNIEKGDCSNGVAQEDDRVHLYYTGHAGLGTSGAVFSSRQGGTPFIFTVGEPEVLKAFSTGVLGACANAVREIRIPAEKAELTPLTEQGKFKDVAVPYGSDMTFVIKVVHVYSGAVAAAIDKMQNKLRTRNNVTKDEFAFSHKKHNFPLDYEDVDSRTFLITACFTGNSGVVEYLMENGVSPDHSMKTGLSPLMYASGEGHTAIVKALLDKKADTGLSLHGGPFGGYTALHFAALTGRVDIIEMLVDAGADPNARNQQGNTPWQTARSIATGGSHAGIKREDRIRCKRNIKDVKKLLLPGGKKEATQESKVSEL